MILTKIVKTVKREATIALCKRFGFTVGCAEFGGVHHCWTIDEAYDWLGAYADAQVDCCIRHNWSKHTVLMTPEDCFLGQWYHKQALGMRAV